MKLVQHLCIVCVFTQLYLPSSASGIATKAETGTNQTTASASSEDELDEEDEDEAEDLDVDNSTEVDEEIEEEDNKHMPRAMVPKTPKAKNIKS